MTLRNCSAAGLDYTWSTTLGTLSDPTAREPVLSLPDVALTTPVMVTLSVSSVDCGSPDQTSTSFDLLPTPAVEASASPDGACAGTEEVFFTGQASGSSGSRLKSEATSEPEWSPISSTSKRMSLRSCQSGTRGTRV